MALIAAPVLASEPLMTNDVVAAYGNRKHGFQPNHGQYIDQAGNAMPFVLLKAEKAGLQFFVTTSGLTYHFARVIESENNRALEGQRINAQFAGAAIHRDSIDWLDRSSDAYVNYYQAHCPNGIRRVYEYNRVRIRSVYPGIDLDLRVTDDGFKYDFVVQPGANKELIKIIYEGADRIVLQPDGKLRIESRLGNLIENAPVSFQNNTTIGTRFKLANDTTVIYEIDAFDSNQELTIDPEMIWGTFYGGIGRDNFKSITVDKQNRLVATGYTESINFPLQNSGYYYNSQYNATGDVIITRFNANYSLQWSTFYGGTGGNYGTHESGYGIATDASSNIFVTGRTEAANFPVEDGGGYFDYTLGGFQDAFLIKFDANGDRLFATYIGGSGQDRLYDISVNNQGDVFLCGHTTSSDFPILQVPGGYFDSQLGGVSDGVVMKFSNNGNLLWSTYLGGANEEFAFNLAIDNPGNVFIVGYSLSPNFPTVNNGTYFSALAGSRDGFVTKFSPALAMTWSTFYGGSQEDEARYAAVDAQGNLWVSGFTRSVNFPTYAVGNAYLDDQLNNGASGKYDWFFIKFTNAGERKWATLFGGENDDFAAFNQSAAFFDGYFNNRLVVDKCGNAYGSFITQSQDITLKNPGCTSFFDNNLSGSNDCFVVKFLKSGSLYWASYYGGASQNDGGLALALDARQTLVVAGSSDKTQGVPLEMTGLAYFDNSASSEDVTLAAFRQPSFTPTVNYSMCSGFCNGQATVGVNSTCNMTYTYAWSNGGSSPTAVGLCPGLYQVTITDTTNCFIDTVDFNLTGGIEVTPLVDAYSCNMGCTGSAAVVVPGVSNLTYAWSNGATNSNLVALCPGNYSVTVTSPGCGSDVASFSIILPPPLTITLNSVTQTCPGNCTNTATVWLDGGATIPYAVWSNGDTGTVADSLCAGQTYQVIAMDSLCYSTELFVTVPTSPGISVFLDVNQGCPCETSLFAQVNNGTQFTYAWSNGATSATAYNLCPGPYSVTVTDAICGTATGTYNVVPPPPPNIANFTFTGSACNPCGVNINTVLVPGAYATPLSSQWSNGTNIMTPPYNFCIGNTYYVTITDACGASDSDSTVVFLNVAPLTATHSITVYTCP